MVTASQALDLGILPLGPIAKAYFAEEMQHNRLPPVRNEMWVRYNPIPGYNPVGCRPTDVEMAHQSRFLTAPQNRNVIYPEGAPIVTIESEVFTTRLAPPGGVPLTAVDLAPLHINLSVLLRNVCAETATTFNQLLV